MAEVPLGRTRRLIGLGAAIALAILLWYLYDTWGQPGPLRRLIRQSGQTWMLPWVVDLRMPLFCGILFGALSVLSWIWQKLRLGH